MKISSVIEILRNGELAQLPLFLESKSTDTNIKKVDDAKALDRVLSLINQGMTELYSKFPLNIKEYILPFKSNSYFYDVPQDFIIALSASLLDQNDPENTKLFDIPINNDNNSSYGVFFPVWNKMQVKIDDNRPKVDISISYIAGPETIFKGTIDENGLYPNLEEELKLPLPLIDALTLYVGYKAYAGISGLENKETMTKFQLYENSYLKAKENGNIVTSISLEMPNRLYERGFV